jgi:molybdopterin-binding protein
MKIGARNQIIGKVTEVKKGSIMCQVKLDVPASKMASVMTLDSAEEMGLKKGDRVRVIVKAIHVLLMKE